MAKLWDKGYTLDSAIERFTVGSDYILDARLVRADCIGTIAHARMLTGIGVLSEEEFHRLRAALLEILEMHFEGSFVIAAADEDVHTAVEGYLTNELGDLGKKIHAARSRNDQVLCDLRLYAKERLLAVEEAVADLCDTLLAFAREHEFVPMPGRTHCQIAMPSSLGLWTGALIESLLDDLDQLAGAYRFADQSALGAGASYGGVLPIDRELTADLLGFSRVQNNVLYVNNSRGKLESIVLAALAQVMMDLAKYAQELVTFSMPEFGYFRIPQSLCTGSSLMPQKRNPCGLELVRARAGRLVGLLTHVLTVVKALPTGYNRDFQETKAPLMSGLESTEMSLAVMDITFRNIEVDEQALARGFTPEIFATDATLRLVSGGVPFRDAYRRIAAGLDDLSGEDPVENLRSKTHTGATGNLRLDFVDERLQRERARIVANASAFKGAIEKLLGIPYPEETRTFPPL